MEKKKITIYQTSDVHGYLYPSNYQARDEDQAFGLFKLASLLKEESEGSSILVDNGDFLQGSPFSYYIYKHDHKADRLMEAYNDLDFDLGVLGNHEFNYGLDYLKSAISASHFPILAANILDEEGQPAFGKAYEIMERDGIKIAILGLTTQYIPHFEHPDHIRGLTFVSVLETAQKYLPFLRDQADLVIVSYHGGFEVDLGEDLGDKAAWSKTGENEGLALLEACGDSIDLFLTGHQHKLYQGQVLDTPVLMPGHKGSHLAKADLFLEKQNGQWTLTDCKPQLLPVESRTAVDQDLAGKFQEVNQEVEDWLDIDLGYDSNNNLSIEDVHQARLEGHPYMEFINRVQMYYSRAPISASSFFNNEVKGFREQITMRDIVSNYIYPNTLAVVKITGQDLKAALEQTAEYYDLDEAGHLVINEAWLKPKPQVYNYDIYQGIDYTFDIQKDKGQRVTKLEFQGQSIQPDQELELVLNQYRAVGGGDYHMFGSQKIVREVTRPMTELIAEYIEKFGPLKIPQPSNFKVTY